MRESSTKHGLIGAAAFVVIATLFSAGMIVSGATMRWVILFLLVVCVFLTAMKFGVRPVGIALSYVAVGTAPWNAVVVAGLRPSDVALAAAIGCLLLGRNRCDVLRHGDPCVSERGRPRPSSQSGWAGVVVPPWLIVVVVAVVATYLGHVLLPTSAAYFGTRRMLDPIGLSAVSNVTDLGVAVRWLVSLIVVPLLFVVAGRADRRLPGRLAVAYVAGAVVSGIVAVADTIGFSSVSATFVVPDLGGRQAGLAFHPNHLAATMCLAVPFAAWILAESPRPRARIFGVVALIALGAGVYVSGSRGGVVCFAVALILSTVALRRLRAIAVVGAVGLATVALAVFAVAPQLFDQAGTDLRLSSGATFVAPGSPSIDSIGTSDQVRAALAAQGDADFWHSPFFGVGLRVALDAHDIWRQVLAAGGIVLAAAFIVFAVGAVRTGLVLGRRFPLAYAAAASIAVWLLFGTVENLLTDRFLYVPIGMVVALAQPAMSAPPSAARRRSPSHSAVPA